MKVSTRVVKIVEDPDVIFLQSKKPVLCTENIRSKSIEAKEGMYYVLMGYSNIYDNDTNTLALSPGIVGREKKLCLTGSGCYFEGGGSCWDKNGNLIGIEIERKPFSQFGRKASDGRIYILPILWICAQAQELPIPAEYDPHAHLDDQDDVDEGSNDVANDNDD
uniref:Peptidase S1 domain-containing protein n=1 Tax=Caenorhabditis tropicalis TaxID=1561998 RepID=A0A1I7TJ22_9PELO